MKTANDLKAVPDQEKQQYLELVDELTAYFSSTLMALNRFATDCIRKTKFTKSLVAMSTCASGGLLWARSELGQNISFTDFH